MSDFHQVLLGNGTAGRRLENLGGCSRPVWSKAIHFLNETGPTSMLAVALSGFSPVIRSKGVLINQKTAGV